VFFETCSANFFGTAHEGKPIPLGLALLLHHSGKGRSILKFVRFGEDLAAVTRLIPFARGQAITIERWTCANTITIFIGVDECAGHVGYVALTSRRAQTI
jgi:hypothetical protein